MLEEKIKAGRYKLEAFFPEFASYQLPSGMVGGYGSTVTVVLSNRGVRRLLRKYCDDVIYYRCGVRLERGCERCESEVLHSRRILGRYHFPFMADSPIRNVFDQLIQFSSEMDESKKFEIEEFGKLLRFLAPQQRFKMKRE